jgi:hypothetical protein
VSGQTHCVAIKSTAVCVVNNFCQLFHKKGNNNFKKLQNMVVMCIYHTYHVMLVYLGVVLHIRVCVLTIIRQRWRPLVKLYRSDSTNGNELHSVRVISWKSTYVGSNQTAIFYPQVLRRNFHRGFDGPTASAKAFASVSIMFLFYYCINHFIILRTSLIVIVFTI